MLKYADVIYIYIYIRYEETTFRVRVKRRARAGQPDAGPPVSCRGPCTSLGSNVKIGVSSPEVLTRRSSDIYHFTHKLRLRSCLFCSRPLPDARNQVLDL